MKSFIKIILLLALISACKKTPDVPNTDYKLRGGVFILNEGNFNGGNGSLSFYSYDSSKIYNDVFTKANARPLGDVPYSMILLDENAYILVNNSGKIEVVDQTTLQSKETITGLVSPRNMAVINDNKVYVTSLYSDSVSIIDPVNNIISGYINLRRTSEAIVLNGNKAFISNWAGGNEIMVINTTNNIVIDSIKVGLEPESIAIDKNGMIWILCDGGWSGLEYPEILQINPNTNSIAKTLVFTSKDYTPSCLRIDGPGQNLYFLDNGVKKMDIGATSIPESAFIVQKSGETFYKIGINPVNGDILVTDAVDYVQQGYVTIYDSKGILITKQKAGINPASMCFKMNSNIPPARSVTQSIFF